MAGSKHFRFYAHPNGHVLQSLRSLVSEFPDIFAYVAFTVEHSLLDGGDIVIGSLGTHNRLRVTTLQRLLPKVEELETAYFYLTLNDWLDLEGCSEIYGSLPERRNGARIDLSLENENYQPGDDGSAAGTNN